MSFCLPSPLYFGEKGVMLCLYRLLPVVKAGENVLFSCHPPGLDVTINRSVPESQTVLHPAFLRSPCMLTIQKRNDAGRDSGARTEQTDQHAVHAVTHTSVRLVGCALA
jgi:hypothetical protein